MPLEGFSSSAHFLVSVSRAAVDAEAATRLAAYHADSVITREETDFMLSD